MKKFTDLGKSLTKDQMKNVIGGIGIGEPCGSTTCSRFQACCSREGANGQIILYCTTTACL